MSQLLTKAQAAVELNVHPRTINRLVAASKLKAVKFGNVFRVDPAEIEKFKRKSTTK